MLSQMDHPNVVKLYEIFDEGDCMYLVLELMSGGEVRAKIGNLTLLYSCSTELSRRNITLKRRQPIL